MSQSLRPTLNAGVAAMRDRCARAADDMFEAQQFAMEGSGEPEFSQYAHGAFIAKRIRDAIRTLPLEPVDVKEPTP